MIKPICNLPDKWYVQAEPGNSVFLKFIETINRLYNCSYTGVRNDIAYIIENHRIIAVFDDSASITDKHVKITPQQFLDCYDPPAPQFGQLIEVSDNCSNWLKYFFVAFLPENANEPVVVTCESNIKNGNTFDTDTWTYWRPYKEPKKVDIAIVKDGLTVNNLSLTEAEWIEFQSKLPTKC